MRHRLFYEKNHHWVVWQYNSRLYKTGLVLTDLYMLNEYNI